MSLTVTGAMTSPSRHLMKDAGRLFGLAAYPATFWVKRRNTVLDAVFYDIRNLTPAEYHMLSRETNREGSILVVWPSGQKGRFGVQKFFDYESLCRAPGRKLTRFSIAGVGSSDVGAASLARTVADRYGEPVGAIVAGYGVTDVLSEALGGWFILGLANRLLDAYHDAHGRDADIIQALKEQSAGLPVARAWTEVDAVTGSADTDTLLRLLLEDERTIASVAGHSKGSLAIAYALEALAATGKRAAFKRAQAMRITTAGAVVALPDGITNCGQYLGRIDGLGALNSEPDIPCTIVPDAAHHLNTRLPLHLDFAEALAREPD